MWRWRSISETLVGTLADTSERGFVALEALEWTDAELPSWVCSLA
jgi:hypothetical protein